MSRLILTDDEIAQLLKMPKTAINPGAKWKEQRQSKQKNFSVQSDDEKHRFLLYLRQNMRVQAHFSCGLYYHHPSGEKVTLTRYNGSDHPHGNPIEGSHIDYQCHIHVATQRYMEQGRKPDHYAEPTDRYTCLDGALRELILDCNISGVPLPEPTSHEDQLDLHLK